MLSLPAEKSGIFQVKNQNNTMSSFQFHAYEHPQLMSKATPKSSGSPPKKKAKTQQPPQVQLSAGPENYSLEELQYLVHQKERALFQSQLANKQSLVQPNTVTHVPEESMVELLQGVGVLQQPHATTTNVNNI